MSQDKPDPSRRRFLAAGGGLMVGLVAWHETIRQQLSDPDCPLKPEVESVPPSLTLMACGQDACSSLLDCNPKTVGCLDQSASICMIQITLVDGDCIGHFCNVHTCHDMWCRSHFCAGGKFHCDAGAYTVEMPDFLTHRVPEAPSPLGMEYAKSLRKG